ncbi:putative reverse transcriptase domain-containing protein, partial [Tanacetum coccineum]
EYNVSTSIGYGVSSSLSNTKYSSQQINTDYPLPLDKAYQSSGTETEILVMHAKDRWLRNEPTCSIKTWEDLKTQFLNKYCPPGRTAKKMKEINNFQQEPDETLYQACERFKELLMKCPQHYLTEMQERKKYGYYTSTTEQSRKGDKKGGGYRATAPGYYQRNSANPSYQQRMKSMEDTLSKFMSESAKRREENSNLIKEIRATTDAAIRNQGASIKTLEKQIGQISKVLQERGFGSLPSSTETNPRDQVKSISTTI